MKIACAVIVGDNASKKDWDRMVTSLVDNHIDALFVNYNGEKKKFPYSKRYKIDITVEHNQWTDDFSEARNVSFDMVPREDFDWIMWLDTDDKLCCDGDIHEILKLAPEDASMVITDYHYGIEPDSKTVLVLQRRERFLRSNSVWRWKYPIHEVCIGPPGFKSFLEERIFVEHYRTEGIGDRVSRARNRRILSKARMEDPDEPRFDNYMANEIFAESTVIDDDIERTELLETAVELWSEFIKKTNSEDEAYIANERVATAYRLLGDHNKAIDTALQCIKVRPTWPDAYNSIAESFMAVGDYEKAREFATMCLSIARKPDTLQVHEPLSLEYKPKLTLAVCAEQMGDKDKALELYYECAAMDCAHPEIEERIKDLKNREIEPSINKRDDLLISNRSRGDKSIAFFTMPLFEPWHPEYEKVNGSGGAEKCVMELSKRFAADGWRVAVFGTPGDYRGIDENGIEWYDVNEDWVNGERFSVIVSSRFAGLFSAKQNCDLSLLWLHDVNGGENFFKSEYGNTLDSIDGIITLTDWHKNHTKNLYDIDDEKLFVIPNGITLDRFENWDRKKQRNKFVWSSSPDRGIDTLLGIWPDIRERFDDAELHVFYGWESINKIIKQSAGSGRSKMLEDFKYSIVNEVTRLNKQREDIFWHGRLSQDELAKQLMTCDRWLYPTHFMETFCITALEMQAAGVIPLTSNLAALNETVASNDLMIRGNTNNEPFRRAFVDKLVETQSETEDQKMLRRNEGRRFSEQFTWDNAYKIWNDYISSEIK